VELVGGIKPAGEWIRKALRSLRCWRNSCHHRNPGRLGWGSTL
jgi:hypothetical protein